MLALKMKNPLDFMPKRRRNLFLCLAAVAGTGYGVYRVYNSPSMARKKYQIVCFLRSVMTMAEAASASAQTISLVSNDLNNFLRSDSDEIPASLKQLLKVAQCQEFQQTLTRVSSALTAGVLQGIRGPTGEIARDGQSETPGIAERMMDRLFTPAGTGFVSVVAGNFARNLVLSFLENYRALNNNNNNNLGTGVHSSPNLSSENSNLGPPVGSGFVDVLCRSDTRVLIAECIRNFVSTAVGMYLDKTMNINVYDEICSSLTNPKHEAQMKGILISVLNGAVETLVKTSHDVLTNGSSSRNAGMLQTKFIHEGGGGLTNGSCSKTIGMLQNTCNRENEIELSDCVEETEAISSAPQKTLAPFTVFGSQMTPRDQQQTVMDSRNADPGLSTTYHSWVDRISHTLAIPSNQKLFIEVSGRMTFEAIRSFCEFMLCKFSNFCFRTLPAMGHEASDGILEFMRYVGAKSIVIATLCLAICLHGLTGVRVLEVT